jgi:hypothetical protein
MKLSMIAAIRAFARLTRQKTTLFAVTVFLASVGVLFAYGLFSAEGTAVSAPSIWALSVAYILPLLTSLLTMRLWSEDGILERMESDLVVPVPERVFAVGRFSAAYFAVIISVALALAVPLFILPGDSQSLSSQLNVVRFLPAFAALAVLALPLTATGSMMGVLLRNPMSAAVASVAVTYALPYVTYRALVSWRPAVRMKFAESPVLAQIADASDGFFSFGAAVAAFAFTVFALFAASKMFALRRIVGDGRLMLKVSSQAAILSALLFAVLMSALALRLDFMIEWPGAVRTASFSARTREILSEISRPVRISACIRRDSPQFLPVSRLLRLIESESRSVAGAGVTCEFVDPRWDPNAARRLVRAGAGEDTIVFSAGRRRIALPVKDIGESACASAIQRLSMPAKSETILFTTGHGEPSIDDFAPSGLGDCVRALRQEGYRVGVHHSLTSSVPDECSVLVIVGARTPFSLAELRDVGMFIAHGGRILVADSGLPESGVRVMLDRIGIVPVAERKERAGTTDGFDIIVSDFGDHAISTHLHGSAVLFANGAKRYFVPAAQVSNAHGFSLSALCPSGEYPFVVAAEKGAALRSDLAIRPARIVAIGDPSFFLNEALRSRANANRDLLLNSIAWLAGLDVSGAAGVSDSVLSVRMDRASRIRFLVYSSFVFPLAVAVLVGIGTSRRRRRSK